MRNPGKKVGSCVYVHFLYASTIIPLAILSKAKRFLKGFDYNCIKWDKKTNNLTFQYSPDFDVADEPIVGDCFLVRPDGTTKFMKQKKDPQIWHHKWMWVADDYKWFDIEESKARSKQWEPHVTKEEKRKIGTLSFWKKISSRFENA